MRRLLLMLLPLFMMVAVPLPCSAALPEYAGGAGEEMSFSAKELNSPMMQTSEPEVMTADGNLPSKKSKSFFAWLWSHPILLLLLLSLLLGLVFYCIIRSIKYWV